MHWTNAWYIVLWPQYLDYLHPRKQGVGVELVHWITTPSDHCAEFLLSDPANVGAGLESTVPNGIGERRQQGEASSCVHSKCSIKAEVIIVRSHKWNSTPRSYYIAGCDSEGHKEGYCNTMCEDRNIYKIQEFTGAFFAVFMPTDELNGQLQ